MDKCEKCGTPIDETSCCSCEKTVCYHCCTCGPKCQCGCQEKEAKEKTE